MRPDSPTQQKIKQREEDIIEAALLRIECTGYGSLTLEQLARDIGCSKGTIYNHFSNKEDLLLELGSRCYEGQQKFYNRLDNYEGNSREKIMGIFLAYQIYSFLNPGLFSCILNLQNTSVMGKASQERLNRYRTEEMRVVSRLVTTIQGGFDACEKREGSEKIEKTPANFLNLAFAGWALAFGNISLMMSSQGAFLTQQADRERQLFASVQIFLDGTGWQPLSSEKDYEKSWHEIGELFFAAELDELKRRQLNKKG